VEKIGVKVSNDSSQVFEAVFLDNTILRTVSKMGGFELLNKKLVELSSTNLIGKSVRVVPTHFSLLEAIGLKIPSLPKFEKIELFNQEWHEHENMPMPEKSEFLRNLVQESINHFRDSSKAHDALKVNEIKKKYKEQKETYVSSEMKVFWDEHFGTVLENESWFEELYVLIGIDRTLNLNYFKPGLREHVNAIFLSEFVDGVLGGYSLPFTRGVGRIWDDFKRSSEVMSLVEVSNIDLQNLVNLMNQIGGLEIAGSHDFVDCDYVHLATCGKLIGTTYKKVLVLTADSEIQIRKRVGVFKFMLRATSEVKKIDQKISSLVQPGCVLCLESSTLNENARIMISDVTELNVGK
jgi:hypothetical protein